MKNWLTATMLMLSLLVIVDVDARWVRGIAGGFLLLALELRYERKEGAR